MLKQCQICPSPESVELVSPKALLGGKRGTRVHLLRARGALQLVRSVGGVARTLTQPQAS